MHFENVDWVVLGISVVVIFAPALFFARRASRDTTEFFASGRSAPWWLVGTSMVATTFATDTPGFVTQVVRDLLAAPATAQRQRHGLLRLVLVKR